MKTRIALLAASAVACASAHAASVVEMYGSVMPVIESVQTTGASAAPAAADRPNQVAAATYTALNEARRNRITVGSSNWGFRGYEDIGTDLRVVWQMESGFQVDQNTGPGWGARDSKVGLRSTRWGEVFMGQWDTPYKIISLPVNPLRVAYMVDRSMLTSNPGFNVPNTTTQLGRSGAKPDASFDRRVGNIVQYWSPNWGGFTFRVAHGVNETKGAIVAGGPVIQPTVTGASVQYDRGQLSLRYGYEQHDDYFGMTQIGGAAAGTATNPGSKDRGHKFVVLWRIGGTRLTGMIEQLEYKAQDSVAGNVNGYKRKAFWAVVEQRFGEKNSIWVSYGRADDGTCTRVGGASCNTHALGADLLTIGYIYRLSRRTELFVIAYRLQNKENAQYGTSPVVAASGLTAPGSDTKGVGTGIFHTF
jgi:predicted porin